MCLHKTTNYKEYLCPRCTNCYLCVHKFQERTDGWWVRCPTGKWNRCVPSYTIAQKVTRESDEQKLSRYENDLAIINKKFPIGV